MSPFGMAIVVPTLELFANEFESSYSTIQFIISAYLFGLAIAQPFMGFLSDKRRLNVALTRAKYSSIVLGSRDTLSRCGVDALRSLVEDAAARDVIVSEHDIVRRIIRN